MPLIDPGASFFLFRSMLNEEWRLQRSFVGSFGAYFFPLVIFLMSTVMTLLLPIKDGTSPVIDVLVIMMFLYGLGIGGIALMGEQIMERRLGEVHLLLKTPLLQPVSFRSVVSIFFFKEAVFYHLYSSIPLSLGLLIGGLLSGTDATLSLLLILSAILSFSVGMSLSFLLSGFLVRSRKLGLSIILGFAVLITALSIMDVVRPLSLLHPLYFWESEDMLYILLSILEVIFLTITAVLIMKPGSISRVKSYQSRTLTIYSGLLGSESKRALLAKEWLELRRSGTLGPVLFSFIGPLMAVYGLVMLFREGMDVSIEFNTVFYGALIGFFGMMTYSWINNAETNESLNSLPVGVPQLIDIKLLLYFIITVPISFIYITFIAVVNGEIILLPAALLVGLSTNIYVAFIVARLTGLKTNSMLLDAVTLTKFSLLVIPPLILMVILSFYLEEGSTVSFFITALVSLLLVWVSVYAKNGISRRWKEEMFGM